MIRENYMESGLHGTMVRRVADRLEGRELETDPKLAERVSGFWTLKSLKLEQKSSLKPAGVAT